MTVGLGLSVAAGIAVVIFGRARGGDFWRLSALGVGVAGAGEAATLLARSRVRYHKPHQQIGKAINLEGAHIEQRDPTFCL
jgi:hypothetical protein